MQVIYIYVLVPSIHVCTYVLVSKKKRRRMDISVALCLSFKAQYDNNHEAILLLLISSSSNLFFDDEEELKENCKRCISTVSARFSVQQGVGSLQNLQPTGTT